MKSRNRVLVVGASGFAGGSILSSLASSHEVLGTYRSKITPHLTQADLNEPDQIFDLLNTYQPSYVVWAAGNKNVGELEKHPDLAFRDNVNPISNLVQISSRLSHQPRLIYLSTDYVFSGQRGRYLTSQAPDPRTEYGKSKAQAEELLLKSKLDFKVIRLAALQGQGGVFFEWAIGELQKAQPLPAFSNVYFSPTPMYMFTAALAKLIENWPLTSESIVHLCHSSRLSRYQLVSTLKEVMGAKALASVVPQEADFSKITIPPDLSMVPSSCFSELTSGSLPDLLKMELQQ